MKNDLLRGFINLDQIVLLFYYIFHFYHTIMSNLSVFPDNYCPFCHESIGQFFCCDNCNSGICGGGCGKWAQNGMYCDDCKKTHQCFFCKNEGIAFRCDLCGEHIEHKMVCDSCWKAAGQYIICRNINCGAQMCKTEDCKFWSINYDHCKHCRGENKFSLVPESLKTQDICEIAVKKDGDKKNIANNYNGTNGGGNKAKRSNVK